MTYTPFAPPHPTTRTIGLDYTPPPLRPPCVCSSVLCCVCVYMQCGQFPMLDYRYPPSLLRIISSRRLLQEGGLLHFFDTDAAWQYK